jgi:hypothetical protein
LATVIWAVPAFATSDAKIAAVNCVALTNVVARAVPWMLTSELLRKFVPFTVRVNAADPAATLAGCNVVTVGTGLLPAVMENVTVFDVPPPGDAFVTLTRGDPALAMSAATIAAVTCVALT